MRRFQLGDAIIDERQRTVTIEDNTQVLTDLTWRFLKALIEVAPDVVGQGELATRVWDAEHVSDETIAQRVRQLRQVFADDPKMPTYIRTIRGGGYQLIPAVKVLSVSAKRARTRQVPKRGLLVGVGVLLAALAGISIMAVQRGPETKIRSVPGATPDVAELVTRAHEYRRRGQYASNEHAVALYEQVLDADPNNVSGLVGLSYSLSHKPSRYEESSDWAVRAADLADQALLIDAQNADAWAARGLADDARGRVSSALSYYRKALELDPDNADLHASIAYLLQVQGKLYEALKLEAEALSKAPPTYFADYQISITLEKSGLKAAAIEWLQRAEQLRPDNVYLTEYKAHQLIANGQTGEARSLLKSADNSRISHATLNGITAMIEGKEEETVAAFLRGQKIAEANNVDCYPCLAALAGGDDNAIIARIDRLLSEAPETIKNGEEWPEFRVELAYLLAARGEATSAQQALEQAFELGYLDGDWLSVSPFLSSLHITPAFEDLISRMDEHAVDQKRLIENDPALSALLER